MEVGNYQQVLQMTQIYALFLSQCLFTQEAEGGNHQQIYKWPRKSVSATAETWLSWRRETSSSLKEAACILTGRYTYTEQKKFSQFKFEFVYFWTEGN